MLINCTLLRTFYNQNWPSYVWLNYSKVELWIQQTDIFVKKSPMKLFDLTRILGCNFKLSGNFKFEWELFGAGGVSSSQLVAFLFVSAYCFKKLPRGACSRYRSLSIFPQDTILNINLKMIMMGANIRYITTIVIYLTKKWDGLDTYWILKV